MSTTTHNRRLQQRPRTLRRRVAEDRNHRTPRQGLPRVAVAVRPSSVMGPADRIPGLSIMGAPDRLPRRDLMSGSDQVVPSILGNADPGRCAQLMGVSDSRFVDFAFTGHIVARGER